MGQMTVVRCQWALYENLLAKIFVITVSKQKIIFYRSCRRFKFMKRKSDFTSALDEMFCEDDKKRMGAIKVLKQIGVAIGPIRTRNELVPFLSQFLDDDPAVMLTLLEELENFTPILGGSEHEKILLPLLINFCLLDEKEVALKSVTIIEQILTKHTDCYLDAVKKLAKPQMSVSKQSAAILIANGVKRVPHLEASFLQTYKTLVFSENASVRIIAAKYLKKLTQNTGNKDEIFKIIDIFFNDPEDLPKLLVIDSLLSIYPINPTAVVNKLKSLICMGTWRINLRLCEFAEQFSKCLSKIHFKTLLQPTFLKMMTSDDNQIRAASCSALIAIAKNMTPEENCNKLYPIIQKLSEDKVDFVRSEFARNFVKIFPYFSADKTKECLIPIVIKCLKQSSLEVSSGVFSDFKELSKYIKVDKFEENILKPLANQLATENWRLSTQTLDILGTIVVQQNIYTNFIIETLLKELKSKKEAVRIKASEIIVNIIKNGPKDWCESEFLPVLMKSKDEPNYLIKQRIIFIINQTAQAVSLSWLGNYRKVIGEFLVDKIPNIRVLALKSVSSNRRLLDKGCENLVYKLKEDADIEIKQVAKEIRI